MHIFSVAIRAGEMPFDVVFEDNGVSVSVRLCQVGGSVWLGVWPTATAAFFGTQAILSQLGEIRLALPDQPLTWQHVES